MRDQRAVTSALTTNVRGQSTRVPDMRITGTIVGSVLALMGAVWTLQGLNSRLVPQSFMTGSRTWIAIGMLTFLGGIALGQSSWSRR